MPEAGGRRPLVAANWKMNRGAPAEARELAAAVRRELEALGLDPGRPGEPEVVLCPPYTGLAAAGEALARSGLELGAQDLDPRPAGAFTGGVSAAMLLGAGARWAIVGHSERRLVYGEDDAAVQRKVAAALQAGLRPILCVGETAEERDAGRTEAVVGRQLAAALAGLEAAALGRLVVAYEPVWAIGTGRAAQPEDAAQVAAFIRERAGRWLGGDAAELRVLYGGSVKAANAEGFLRQAELDGALVGGASLEAAEFAAIVAAARRRGGWG
ncbi:MAG: triose-phosphate isomerase, partial [Clostridia bacterium]|nr:triose-phosphate isomerase [Clostridia bacterium]